MNFTGKDTHSLEVQVWKTMNQEWKPKPYGNSYTRIKTDFRSKTTMRNDMLIKDLIQLQV